MGAAAVARLLVATAALALRCSPASAYPEQGKYDASHMGGLGSKLTDACHGTSPWTSYGFTKSMYGGTNVTVKVSCLDDSPANISIGLYLVHSNCYNEGFLDCLIDLVTAEDAQLKKPTVVAAGSSARDQRDADEKADDSKTAASTTKAKGGEANPKSRRCSCRSSDEKAAVLPDPEVVTTSFVKLRCPEKPPASSSRRRRENKTPTTGNQGNAAATTAKPEIESQPDSLLKSATLSATARKDGFYLVLLRAIPDGSTADSLMNFTVDSAEVISSYGYLSAVDWPNYYFYMILVIVYIIFQLAWLVMLACNWRDLLRVQYFIGAVILLGMIEKAVLFAEYENINKSGVSIYGAVIFAQIVSSLKRALSRVLIILVCLGYGIVKPRLGPTLQKVLAAGVIYFVVASVEGCIRSARDSLDQNADMVAAIVLVVVEVGICWWIFTSLVQTYRTLRLRRNVVKLSLYRHFANTLIFSVLASLAFIIWFLYAVRFSPCVSDLKELWLEEGFWQMLFTLLLLIVIILWRPSANNQRYAFAPLLDAGEDGDEDENYTVVMGETFTGAKLRTPGSDNQKKAKDREYRAEDDLKWIEDNIPTTALADKVLTVDSDEERVTARNEISKMD